MPAGLGLAVYRVVQEALTNVVRHSGADRAKVEVGLTASEVVVVVSNEEGSRALTANDSGGLGITGMRERVALGGGSLEAGPDGNGYRVEARFPLDRPIP